LKTPPKEVREARQAEKELELAQQYNNDVHAKLNRISSDGRATPAVQIESHVSEPSTSLVKRESSLPVVAKASRPAIPLSVLFLLLLSLLANYKTQSSSLGFCDSGDKTNNIILNRQSALDDANACLERKTSMELNQPGSASGIHCDVSALPMIPLIPRPTACTPCPPHAICEEGAFIACETEYITHTHPLAILSPVLDGVPGLGPKALAPSCKPDTARKRMVGGLAKEIEGDLARGRGMVVCSGLDRKGKDKGKEVKRLEGAVYGMEEGTLRGNYAARRDVSGCGVVCC
jgi:hypothetical protein